MKIQINPKYENLRSAILEVVAGNYVADNVFCNNRNIVEKVTLQGVELVVKKYKRPNLFNRVAYSCFRRSKARRAYEYARRLLENGIDTPYPVAYVELFKGGIFSTGYFFSLYMPYNLIREAYGGNLPDSKKQKFTMDFIDFTLSMHEKKILPMDFNSGNIFYHYDEECGNYRFAITDINRMRFGKVPTTSSVMRSFEQFGVSVEGMYKLAVYYCARKGADVEYSVFIFLFHRIKSRIKRKLKRKAKERLGML